MNFKFNFNLKDYYFKKVELSKEFSQPNIYKNTESKRKSNKNKPTHKHHKKSPRKIKSTNLRKITSASDVIILCQIESVPFPIPICVPFDEDTITIKLFKPESYYIDGGWLYDDDIYAFMRLLKGQFPLVNGLEASNFFTYKSPYVQTPTDDFIRILYCDNKHWITVSGGLGLNNENVCIYDSMPRDSINDYLKKQLEKLIPHKRDETPIINFRIQKTQKQPMTWCGYFACAFATALCYGFDIESLNFDLDDILQHWLRCIKGMKVTMFKYYLSHHSK